MLGSVEYTPWLLPGSGMSASAAAKISCRYRFNSS
jgi:hypothetical protein